ncbi:MAG: hypothetical protein WA777_10025 [Rhodanobacter sp.]
MKHALRVIAGSALLSMLAACQAPAGGNATSPMELKIYAVSPAQTNDLRQALDNALGKQANVSVAAAGKLLVYAPHDAQASIGAAIAELGKSASPQSSPAQVDLHFWIVDAVAGAGDDDPALKGLASSFASLRQTMGPMHFHLDQTASAVTSNDYRGSLSTTNDGYLQKFDFRIGAVSEDAISLWLTYNDLAQSGLTQFQTQIDAHPGQYIVLAQAPGACPAAPLGKVAPPCPDKPLLRLLVVRVDRLNPQS